MEERFDNQARIFTAIMLVVFFLIAGRLWQLQILEGGSYRRLADENAERTIPIQAPRGIIYDRYGRVIVSNRAIFSAYLLPKLLDKPSLDALLSKLSPLLKINKEEVLKKMTSSEPVLIKKNLPLSVVTKLEESREEYPGIVVRAQPIRRYPNGRTATHVLGYVGEVTKEELKELGSQGYELGDLVGKGGVESSYDSYLRGDDGGQLVEVDVYGKPIRTKKSLDPNPGRDIYLSIDLDLQKVVERSLHTNGDEGAVVVIDPRNGEILAMASFPDYDPGIFAEPMDAKEWARLDRGGHPFMNRALSVYPPGSTFKVVTLSGALMEGSARLNEVIDCKGTFKLGNRIAKDWKEEGHGMVNILEALVWSCDVTFYELGLREGVDVLSRYSKEFGLGAKTGVDLPGEAQGLIPTAGWKKGALGEDWVKGDSINMSIGQGFVQVTPIEMANLYGGIATEKRYKPYIVRKVIDHDGSTVYSAEAQVLGGIPISGENLDLLRKALRAVVVRGTGVASKVQGIPSAGKTGTAENPGLPHAWFICWAPYDRPEIVVVSFVAHGEHGDHATAWIARDVLSWYKKNRLAKVYDEPGFNWNQYTKHGPYDGKL